MNHSQPTYSGPKRFLLALVAAVVAAQIVFMVVWYLRNPPTDFSDIISLLPFSLLMISAAAVPVVLFVMLMGRVLPRLLPWLRIYRLLKTFVLALAGIGVALCVVLLMLAQIGLESEFSGVVLLSGAVAGAVAGLTIDRMTS